MKLLILVSALLIGQLCFAEETTTPSQMKNGTGAPGRYRGGKNHHRNHGGYDNDDYHYRAPIVDDYICDLEATILVVSSKHHVKEEKYGGKEEKYGGNQNYGQQGGYGGQNDYNQGGYGGQNDYNQGGYGSQGGNYNQGGGYGSQGGNYNQGGGYGSQGGDYNQGGNYNQGGGYGNQGGDYNQGGNYNQGGYGSSPSSYGGEKKTRRHEYATPEALRLKCSHIAVHSEHDCHTCCQLSARRYHSVSKNDIFGFIVDAAEIKYDDKGYVRSKRDANYGGQQQSYGNSPAPGYDSAPAPSYDSAPAPEYGTQTPGYQSDSGYQGGNSYAPTTYGSGYHYGPPKNARCVCCSPKKAHHHDYHHQRRHHGYGDRSDSHEY